MRRAALALVLLSIGCADEPPEREAPRSQELAEGVVARVGPLEVSAGTVARIAAAQEVPLAEARDRAIYDALFAAAAREDLSEREVERAERRVLARALMRSIWEETSRAPIGEDELAAATARHWTEFDRPKSRRIVHAVVRLDPRAGEGDRARARELASAIRKAVEKASELARSKPAPEMEEERLFVFQNRLVDEAADAFLRAAREVPAEGMNVTVEELPPIGSDMRVLEKGAPVDYRPFDPTFCEAVAELDARGEVSELLETQFGFHVIMLLDVIPERHAPRDERLEKLRDEIWRGRARKAEAELLESLQRELGVEIATNAAALMAEVVLREARASVAEREIDEALGEGAAP